MIVVELPEQIVVLEAVAVTVGVVLTVTNCVDVLVQPLAAVPVTVYVVVADGVTVTGEPDRGPGNHEYVAAPVAVNVVELPVQIEALEAVAVTVGEALTVIRRVEVAVHPFTFVPVTV